MVLKNLSHDDELGLLVSITNRAQSEVLDDLLDQAEEYRKQDHKDGAGALASVVFEDTVRRIAKLSDGIEEGIKLNNTISALAKQGTLTSIKAKQCVAAAGVRNAALHAKWDEFEMSDVKATIELTRELLEIHLAG